MVYLQFHEKIGKLNAFKTAFNILRKKMCISGDALSEL